MKTWRRSQRRIDRLLTGAMLMLAVLTIHRTFAQTTITWSGGGGSNWSVNTNWGGSPPSSGGTYNFIFATGNQLTNYNNVTSLTTASLVFSNTAGAFVLGGNSLTLAGGITNKSANLQTINLNLNLSASETVATTSGNITIGGVISGAHGLTSTGPGTLTLATANTYTGGTVVNSGTLQLTEGGSTGTVIGTLTINTNGTVLSSAQDTFGYATGTSVTNLILNGGTLIQNNTNNLTLSAVAISMTGGTLQSISNSLGIDFYGGTTNIIINASTNTSVIGGALRLRNYIDGQTNGLNTAFNVASGSTANGIDLLISAVISNPQDSEGIIKSGAGVMALTASNTYSGGTTLSAGTLAISNNAALGTGTLTYSGNSTLAALANASITNKEVINSGVTATINDQGFGFTNGGAISGAGALILAGSGTTTLSGNNSFSGTLTVNSGEEAILSGNNSNRPGGISETTLINNGGTLQLQANSGNTVSGISYALGPETTAGKPLYFANGGTLQLLSDSNVTFAGGNNLGDVGAATVTINVDQLTSGNSNHTITFAPGGFGIYSTTIDVTGDNDGYTLALGTLTDVGGGSDTGLTLNANGANLTVAGVVDSNSLITGGSNTIAITQAITGGGSVVQNGTGTLVLSAANTYSGGTTLNAGTLALSNNDALGTGTLTYGGSSTLTALTGLTLTNKEVINSGVTATVNNNGYRITNGGVISGAGGLTSTGAGTLTLTATNSYTGTTTVNSGALSLSTNGALSGTTNVVVNGGTLLLGGSNSINTNSNLTLGGGTLSMGAGTNRAPAQVLNTLTLTANSVIDFANLSGISSLTFSSISGLSTYTLSVYDWNGTTARGTTSTTGGVGQTTSLVDLSGLTASQLANISFYSGFGTGFLGTGVFSGSQIIPVPEPRVVISSLFLLGWLIGSCLPGRRQHDGAIGIRFF